MITIGHLERQEGGARAKRRLVSLLGSISRLEEESRRC